MLIPVKNTIAYTTERVTWVSSGAVAGTIASTLRDRNETLVSSMAATSSGNGAYYALMTMPGSSCWLVNEWVTVINANTYVQRQFLHVLTLEVD